MPGFFFTGFFIIMEMPKDMNGFVKSMTLSRADVMVNGAIAISASYSVKYQSLVSMQSKFDTK